MGSTLWGQQEVGNGGKQWETVVHGGEQFSTVGNGFPRWETIELTQS